MLWIVEIIPIFEKNIKEALVVEIISCILYVLGWLEPQPLGWLAARSLGNYVSN